MSKVGKEELSLNKIMKLEDINPEDVKLIRHSLSDEKFSKCFSNIRFNRNVLKVWFG